jgi:hypothetical protein
MLKSFFFIAQAISLWFVCTPLPIRNEFFSLFTLFKLLMKIEELKNEGKEDENPKKEW